MTLRILNSFWTDCHWNDASTPISYISIFLIDEKRTVLSAGLNSENNNLPYPEASKVIITRYPQNGDLHLDYLQDIACIL
jgi:hypothetical protein